MVFENVKMTGRFFGLAQSGRSHTHCPGLSLHIHLEYELSKSSRVRSLSVRTLILMNNHVKNKNMALNMNNL